MSTPRQAHGNVLVSGVARHAAAILVAMAALLNVLQGHRGGMSPWASIGARATPFSGGSTSGWGAAAVRRRPRLPAGRIPDDPYRRLSLKAEVAFADGKGGRNVTDEVFSPDGPGPRRRRHRLPSLSGHISPGKNGAPRVRRVRLGCLPRHHDGQLPGLPRPFFTVWIDPKGRPPTAPRHPRRPDQARRPEGADAQDTVREDSTVDLERIAPGQVSRRRATTCSAMPTTPGASRACASSRASRRRRSRRASKRWPRISSSRRYR